MAKNQPQQPAQQQAAPSQSDPLGLSQSANQADPTQTGYAIKASNPEEATPEARDKKRRKAEDRQKVSEDDQLPPVHKFKLEYEGITETLAVRNNNKHQAEIDARAIFNDKLPKKVRRPNPRQVKVTPL